MREKNKKPIASCFKLPQFTTMNVIDGQAVLISYTSLIFYSLTIDNILNIIVLILLAMITLAMLTGPNGLLNKATEAKIANDKAEIQDRAETEVLASIGKNGKIDWDDLKNNLASNFEMNKDEITNKGTEPSDGLKFTVEKNKRNYNVDIDGKGKVTVTYEGEVAKGTTTPSTEPSEEPTIEPSEEGDGLIHFTIHTYEEAETQFTAKKGMTWKEFCESDLSLVTKSSDLWEGNTLYPNPVTYHAVCIHDGGIMNDYPTFRR